MEENNNIIYKLITDSNKYANKEMTISTQLQNSNKKLYSTLSNLGIKKIRLTSLGNSIATRYSVNSIIKPTLQRNETLKDDLNDIDLELHSFARAQDNNDEHVLEWINKNIKESEINKQVNVDFGHETTSMYVGDFSKDELDKYYPTNPKLDMGLKNIIQNNEEDVANIIVYNGVTGSFLDNLTRKGKHLNLYGFKRDLISIEAVLKTIYLENPNTQMYVCGIPNFFNINLVEPINKELKKICKLYPNTTYVAPAPARFVYGKDGKIVVDIHYNKHEYKHLNNNIINSINDNYMKNKLFIDFDKKMREYSNKGNLLITL